MKIRLAIEGDRNELADLARLAAVEIAQHRPIVTDAMIKATIALALDHGLPLSVAELDGELVGFCVVAVPIGREEAVEAALWVFPSHRDEQIEQALRSRALERVAELGITRVRATVGVNDSAGRISLAAAGYKLAQLEFVKTLVPA